MRTQIILQKQFPYRFDSDHLLSWDEWLKAQNTGKDKYDNDYPSDNDFSKDPKFFDDDAYTVNGLRRIRNMRDLARSLIRTLCIRRTSMRLYFWLFGEFRSAT